MSTGCYGLCGRWLKVKVHALGLSGFDFAHGVGKLVFGYAGVVAHALAVVVDGLYGVVQKQCNLRAVADAETYERVDAQLGGEEFAFGRRHPRFGHKQLVEPLDEMRKHVEEDGVKLTQE